MSSISTATCGGNTCNFRNNDYVNGSRIGNNVEKELPVVNVAIFGLGRIGIIHLDHLRRNPRVRLVYFVEESTERIDFVKNKLKLVEPAAAFLQPSEQFKVFQDKRVHAVVICLPTFLHEEIIVKSIESGKAVFCEKPLALSAKAVERCVETAKKHSVPLFCAFNRRFDPGMRSLKLRVDSGEIGKVHVIKTSCRDCPCPSIDFIRTSGGFFQDCGLHDIDYICWVLGEYPTSVSAVAQAHRQDIKEAGDYDTIAALMKFPSGALATFDLSRLSVYGFDHRMEVFGPKGMLICENQRPTEVTSHLRDGTTAEPIFYSINSKFKESYSLEMEHFLNVVQGTEKCEIELDGILPVYKIALAFDEVVNTGKSKFLDLN